MIGTVRPSRKRNVAAVEGQCMIKRRKEGEAEKSDIPCPNNVCVSYVCSVV